MAGQLALRGRHCLRRNCSSSSIATNRRQGECCGLELSTRQTKVIVVANEKVTVRITCKVEEVDTFRYLCALFTDTGECSKATMSRLGMAISVIKSISGVWKDRRLMDNT